MLSVWLPRELSNAVRLSIVAAVATIVMKSAAYAVTGSAGLLSDALESLANLAAAATAYLSIRYSARPADATHTFGHEKIEFFAAGVEGLLIVLAAVGTAAFAVERLMNPRPLDHLALGAAIAVAAAAVNAVVAVRLLKVGKAHHSPAAVADGRHLLTDVWTTAAVVLGLALVLVTGVTWLDPVLALGVAVNIASTGGRLILSAVEGLMDRALPPAEQDRIRAAIRAALPPGADFHALRTRRAGRRAFAEFHLLLEGGLTVRAAHAVANAVESAAAAAVPGLVVTTHVEPIDERDSWEADELARLGEPTGPPS